MPYHQITLRKDGPVHAILYDGKYAAKTLCGSWTSLLDKPVRRRFEHADQPCKRCMKSKARLS